MTNRTKYTTDEYQSSFIDYYGDFGGIDVQLAPDPDPDPDPPTAPNILDPNSYDRRFGYNQIYNQDDGAAGTNLGTTPYLPGTAITPINYQQYLDAMADGNDAKTKQGVDKSQGGFSDFVEKNKDLGILSVGLPQPLGAIGAVGGALYRKYTTRNLNAIASTGGTGGGAFKLGPRVVTRAPGERVYTGAEGNVANAAEGIQYGFIPRTWSETEQTNPSAAGTYVKTGKTGLIVSADKQSIMDPFGNYHHISGVQGAGGSRDMRENLLKNAIEKAGISTAGIDIRGDSVNLMIALNAHMKGKIGPFTTVARMGTSEYNKALKDAQDFVADYATRMYGSGTAEDGGGDAGAGTTSVAGRADPRYAGYVPATGVRSPQRSSEIVSAIVDRVTEGDDKSGGSIALPEDTGPTPAEMERLARAQEQASLAASKTAAQIAEEARQRAIERARQQDDEGTPSYSPPTEYSISTGFEDRTDFGRSSGPFAEGGRVGMQMGGTAPQASPAGFVERPPSQVSEAATVADDKPMSVPEGTFVINAAAVEIAGEADIAKMLNKAYENYRARGGKKVMGRTPSKEEVDVAVSRGEVLVPPAIAKIIGYDRLEKINNRGKKETKQRIEENGQSRRGAAGGGFLDAGKYAEGGDVGEDIPFDQSATLDDATRKEFKTFLSSKRQRGDVEKLIDNMDDRGRLFLLGLVETTASTDSLESMTGVMQTAINRANTDRPSFKKVNDLASVMKQRSSRGSGSRMFQYDGLEPKKITPRLQEVMQGRVPSAVTKLFTAAENLMNPETEGQRPLPFDVMFYTKPDAPLAKDFENNPMMRYFTSFGGHDYYALDAAPEGTRK